MTKEEFYQILDKPEKDCDGYEVHIRHLWEDGNAKSLFRTTGLDFTEMFKQHTQIIKDKTFREQLNTIDHFKKSFGGYDDNGNLKKI